MRVRLGVLAIATALTLTACGNGGSTTDTVDEVAATETTAAAAAADFNAPIDLGAGVSLTISAPAAFTPGDFASNFIPGQTAQLLEVAVSNTGDKALDLSTILFTPTSDGAYCSDVLDGDNGINGAPTEPVAAGASTSFKYAVACDAKAGAPFELTVTFGETNVGLEGTIA